MRKQIRRVKISRKDRTKYKCEKATPILLYKVKTQSSENQDSKAVAERKGGHIEDIWRKKIRLV